MLSEFTGKKDHLFKILLNARTRKGLLSDQGILDDFAPLLFYRIPTLTEVFTIIPT